METIDCRGLACPSPVLKVKELIETEAPLTLKITVDNGAAKENVSRFLQSRNYEVTSEEKRGDFLITGTRDQGTECEVFVPEQSGTEKSRILVLVTRETIGRGDDDLGRKLMISFIKTLREMGDELWRLVFVNNGVKLAIGGSEVLPDLHELEKSGVNLLVCGTCLDHFKLLEKKQVGETTNMLDIVTSMQVAAKVITV